MLCDTQYYKGYIFAMLGFPFILLFFFMRRTAEIIGTWERRGEVIVVGAGRLGICASSHRIFIIYIIHTHTHTHVYTHTRTHIYTLCVRWRGRQMTFCGAPARPTGARPNFKKNPAKVNYEWRPHGNDIITRRPSSPSVRPWHACTPLPPRRVVVVYITCIYIYVCITRVPIIIIICNTITIYGVIIASRLLSGPIYIFGVGGGVVVRERDEVGADNKIYWTRTRCDAAWAIAVGVVVVVTRADCVQYTNDYCHIILFISYNEKIVWVFIG